MRILDRLPYDDEPTLLSFHGGTVQVRRHQIIVWVRIEGWVFPAALDTGHSHNFSIPERHLKGWAGIDALTRIGSVEVNRVLLPQYEADIWIHHNHRGTREPKGEASLLRMDEGITVVPEGTPGAPRLPLLGLRAITQNGLTLIIDGGRREVTLKTAGWS